MIGKKRILVACGTAVATSTVVAKAIESALEQHGIQPPFSNARQVKCHPWRRTPI